MTQRRLSSNGGPGKRGFAPFSSSVDQTLFEKIWIPANDLKAHASFPPNGPAVRALPNTVQTFVWIYTAAERDMAFAWFPVVSRYWNHGLTVPTSCKLRLYWYGDVTNNSRVCWGVELCFVRNGETLNFVPPAWTQMYHTNVTQYQQIITLKDDFPIYNPSGSSFVNEGTFFLKVIRDGSNEDDTYPNEAYLLGVSVDFPLTYS